MNVTLVISLPGLPGATLLGVLGYTSQNMQDYATAYAQSILDKVLPTGDKSVPATSASMTPAMRTAAYAAMDGIRNCHPRPTVAELCAMYEAIVAAAPDTTA